ncbi:hypothetical protein ACOMHN_009737 [Nucella lapillus]
MVSIWCAVQGAAIGHPKKNGDLTDADGANNDESKVRTSLARRFLRLSGPEGPITRLADHNPKTLESKGQAKLMRLRAKPRLPRSASRRETIRLLRGRRVFVNGGEVDVPFHTHVANVTLSDDGYVTVVTGCGVVIQYDGLFQVRVITPEEFRHHLHGLCGNCDGNAENDVTVKGRPFFTFATVEEGYKALGHANLVVDDSDHPSLEPKWVASLPLWKVSAPSWLFPVTLSSFGLALPEIGGLVV